MLLIIDSAVLFFLKLVELMDDFIYFRKDEIKRSTFDYKMKLLITKLIPLEQIVFLNYSSIRSYESYDEFLFMFCVIVHFGDDSIDELHLFLPWTKR